MTRAVANMRTLDTDDHHMFSISMAENMALYNTMRAMHGTSNANQRQLYLQDAKNS